MAETILSSPLISQAVLPFILVFTLVFAILQKSKILGEDKKQIDALVGLVVGLITITFASAVGIINHMLPFLAVSIVIILVLLIMIALFHKGGEEFVWGITLKKILTVLSILAVLIAVLVFTGAWGYIAYQIMGPSGSSLITNAIIIAVIGIAFFAVLRGEKTGGNRGEKDK